MIKRILLFLIVVFMATSSTALTYSSKVLSAGQLNSFSWTTGEAVADSDAIQNKCGTVSIGFAPGTGGTASVYAVPDSATAATSGILVATLASAVTGTTYTPAHPYLKIRVTAAPSAGTAKVFMYCGSTAGGGGGGGTLTAADSQRAYLYVADTSYSFGISDEAWASPTQFGIFGGGFGRRVAPLFSPGVGGGQWNGELRVAGATSTGSLFGPTVPGAGLNTKPIFNLLPYVDAHPEVKSVVMMVGNSDYIQANCSHGDPPNPSIDATAVCTVDETIANLKYLMGGLHDRGVESTWFIPPGWLGHAQVNTGGGTVIVEDAVDRVHDAMVTFCAGKLCQSSSVVYTEACRGNVAAKDPTAAGDCDAFQINVGDGSGLADYSNELYFFLEDFTQFERNSAGGFHIHPSGPGWTQLTTAMINVLRTVDTQWGPRFAFSSVSHSNRPGIPNISVGTVTATTIEVTPTRGLHVNGNSGNDGECGTLNRCTYTCWATCSDIDGTSTDPSCAVAPQTLAPRDIGTQYGAGHVSEDPLNFQAPRMAVTLEDGETGLLRALHTGTSYYVTCAAVGATSISYPGIRNVTTP